MAPVVHPGRLLKRELAARRLSANRLSLDIGVPSGRITDILNGRRSIRLIQRSPLPLLWQWRTVLGRLAGPI